MIISPYNTLAASYHQLGAIKSALTTAHTAGELCYDFEYLGSNIVLVVDAKDAVVKIPPFAHPIEFEAVGGKTYTAIDVRPFATMRKSVEDPHMIRNRGEYSLAASRALLQQAWLAKAYDDIRNISTMSGAIFARWLPESIARQFGLDPSVQLDLSIITAYYYFCLYEPSPVAAVHERSRFITQTARAVNTNYDRVEQLLTDVPHIATLRDYCDMVKGKGLSVRLERFEPAIVMQLVAGSWYGNQSREVVGVALEYPPTFMSLVHAAITDRGYFKTRLAEMINRNFNKGDQLRSFEINFKRTAEAWKSVTE